ncbi:TetR/AcrR family transcriptional regulator [Nonomuraea sp. NPDC050404]|uniref:TetR/AcrR family transcriptional regulator n=1 Tax=Nonomuraea sp. NPDC050404 TaxID=3155783 RepID=UPI0033E52A6E
MQADNRPLRADARRNRQRILEAARQAFAAEGRAVSLDEIARRAHVGPGTLYRHFPTKEALFEAIIQERLRSLIEQARAARTAADPAEALFTTIDATVADAQAKAELIDALTGAGIDVQSTVAAMTAEFRQEMARLLTRAQEHGTVRRDVGIAEVMALLGGVILALRGRPALPGMNPERALSVLRDGLRSPASAPATFEPGVHQPSPGQEAG